MSEVRTISSTGGEKGVKDERYDLLPKAALDVIARVYAYGATKYADHNWRRGYEWSKSYAALQRHLTAFWDGETSDPESGLPHLAHAGFHVFALLTWLEEQGESGQFDDRYVPKHRREIVYPQVPPYPNWFKGPFVVGDPLTQKFDRFYCTSVSDSANPDTLIPINGPQRSFDRDCE